MARRDWERFQRDHPLTPMPAADELYELGIRRPEDVESINLRYNFDTGYWEIVIETDYGTFILEDETPVFYDDEIRRNVGDALYEDFDVDYGPPIATAYRKSKGGR